MAHCMYFFLFSTERAGPLPAGATLLGWPNYGVDGRLNKTMARGRTAMGGTTPEMGEPTTARVSRATGSTMTASGGTTTRNDDGNAPQDDGDGQQDDGWHNDGTGWHGKRLQEKLLACNASRCISWRPGLR